MQRLTKLTNLLLLAVFFLSACNLPFGSSVSEADAVRTSAAKTVEVLRTQAAGSGVGANTLPPIHTPTLKPGSVPATQMPQPSITPPNTLIPTKEPTATRLPTTLDVPFMRSG